MNLGRGIYVQTALHTDTQQLLPAQKTIKIKKWAMDKFYKTT